MKESGGGDQRGTWRIWIIRTRSSYWYSLPFELTSICLCFISFVEAFRSLPVIFWPGSPKMLFLSPNKSRKICQRLVTIQTKSSKVVRTKIAKFWHLGNGLRGYNAGSSSNSEEHSVYHDNKQYLGGQCQWWWVGRSASLPLIEYTSSKFKCSVSSAHEVLCCWNFEARWSNFENFAWAKYVK